MKNKKGFTLLELLIAATIIGGLAVMATVSYRNSAAEARIQAAKIRTEVLATAILQFQTAGGTVSEEGTMTNVTGGACSNTVNATSLIGCGYLDNGGWDDAYVIYYICNGRAGNCNISSAILPHAPLACMTGKSTQPKLPDKYKNGYLYCVSAIGSGEYAGS